MECAQGHGAPSGRQFQLPPRADRRLHILQPRTVKVSEVRNARPRRAVYADRRGCALLLRERRFLFNLVNPDVGATSCCANYASFVQGAQNSSVYTRIHARSCLFNFVYPAFWGFEAAHLNTGERVVKLCKDWSHLVFAVVVNDFFAVVVNLSNR